MFQHIEIAPSVLSADFLDLGHDIRLVNDAGARYIHIDVMDGHFVPNLTMGVPLVKALAKARADLDCLLDVHLMIDNPLVQLPWYLSSGMQRADICTIHAEALDGDGLRQAIDMIHDAGVGACVALRPKTAVDVLSDVIDKLEMVLIMSVEPGFSGQSYIQGSELKIAETVKLADSKCCAPLIEVDGGIGIDTAALAARAGADVLVCGNAVFGAADPAEALKRIRDIAEDARIDAIEGQVISDAR